MSTRPDGTYSGEMMSVPPTGEARAQILADYCEAEGFRLRQSSPTQTPRRTCRCSRRSGSRLRSIPRPGSQRSPADRGWLVEQWSKSQGGPRPLLPIGPLMVENASAAADLKALVDACLSAQTRVGPGREGVGSAGERSETRHEGSRDTAQRRQARVGPDHRRPRSACRRPSGSGRSSTDTSTSRSSPDPAGTVSTPAAVGGLRGSDLSSSKGVRRRTSTTAVSFPFVPGHEIVGSLDNGTRVIIEPVLGHEARGFAAPFESTAPGDGDDYAHLATGDLEPGIQTGFCCSTGGGWAPSFVAPRDPTASHRRRHARRAGGSRRAARRRDPHHAAPRGPRSAGRRAGRGGAGPGTMGLATIAGLRRYVPDVRIVVGARYAVQRHCDSVGADRRGATG